MNKEADPIIRDVTQKIVNTINEHCLMEERSSILVAFSGGADSVCLLDVLNRIKKANKFKIYAAHLNHGIRGAEADTDQKFAEDFCQKIGVRCFSKKADIPTIARKNGQTEEEAGRNARYEFFEQICEENNIDAVATAHNRNDQAETVLMRVIRGSGLSGLRGIKYRREDRVIRPLLDVTRREIEEYCNAAGLEYITDSTNADDSYTRNRVRHKLLPMLEDDFNPNVVNALANLALNLDQDTEFIDGYSERLYERLKAPSPGGRYKALHIESLKTVKSGSIVSRLILLCARDTMEVGYSLEKRHIDAVLKIISGEGTAEELPGGLTVRERYGWLEFSKNLPKNDTQSLNSCNNNEFCVEVGTDKLYNIDSIGACISLTVMNEYAYREGTGDMCLDADKLGLDSGDNIKFVVRNRMAGDRIAVYKNGKSKKLKNLFIDKKIRREDRDRIPVLCMNDEIIMIPGVRINEKYKTDRRTKNFLVVHYEKYED